MLHRKKEVSLQFWQIAKANLRHNFLPLFLLALGIVVLTPVLFSTTNLDTQASAVPLEMLLSVIGIVVLTPVFHPDERAEIKDAVAARYVNCTCVYVIRALYSAAAIALLIALFSLYMFSCGCEITVPLVFGAVADAVFLGSLGMLTAAATSNLSVSFMVPLLYYVLNITQKGKLGLFNVFAMMDSSNEANIVLFAAGVAIIVIAIMVKGLKSTFA